MRPIQGGGVELRYEWNVDLRVSQVFRSLEALEAAATDKRREPEARGLALSAAIGRVAAES